MPMEFGEMHGKLDDEHELACPDCGRNVRCPTCGGPLLAMIALSLDGEEAGVGFLCKECLVKNNCADIGGDDGDWQPFDGWGR